MIDIMFSQLQTAGETLAYLVMINTLTRKLYTELMNQTVDGRVQFGEAKNQASFMQALDRMLDGSGLRNFHLIGDTEHSFQAPAVKRHLAQKYGADFTAVALQKSQYPDFMPIANEAVKG
jgi:hypothetical protein